MKTNRTGIWIPVWIERLRLSHSQTKLLAEIVSLHDKGGCFASNQYFSEVIGLKKDTVSRLIAELKKKGIIKQTGFDGRRRFLTPIFKEQAPSVALEKSPSLAKEDVPKFQPSPVKKSNAASVFSTRPLSTIEVHNKLHKSWELFLEWSKGKVTPTTWATLNACESPVNLTGSAQTYWNRWSGVT
ncbi:MAG: helix-turn-helix domain-containing protein [Leptospira sp.]|nr:helix-turn-helix domain-containing protein [Leptospira sp.]